MDRNSKKEEFLVTTLPFSILENVTSVMLQMQRKASRLQKITTQLRTVFNRKNLIAPDLCVTSHNNANKTKIDKQNNGVL